MENVLVKEEEIKIELEEVIEEPINIELINITYHKLNNNWSFWIYTGDVNNWNFDDFIKLYTFDTIEQFWNFYNNLFKIGNFRHFNFYLMRGNNHPFNKNDENINGGVWSIKLTLEESMILWKELILLAIGENLLYKIKDGNNYINNGLSISVKSEKVAVIKIWISNNSFNNIGLLPKNIIAKYNNYLLYKFNNVTKFQRKK